MKNLHRNEGWKRFLGDLKLQIYSIEKGIRYDARVIQIFLTALKASRAAAP